MRKKTNLSCKNSTCEWNYSKECSIPSLCEIGDLGICEKYEFKSQKEIEQYIKSIDLKKINWVKISYFRYLSESFIKKYENKLDLNLITIHQKLSESFIEEHGNKINWHDVSIYQKLSMPFIEKHIKKLHWTNIQGHQRLSESFIEKHKNTVWWSLVTLHGASPVAS